MNTTANIHRLKNLAVALILAGIFTAIAPILFLSQAHDGDSSMSEMPHQVVRVGQSFASIILSNTSSAAGPSGVQKLRVNNGRLVVVLPYPVTHDELEAIVDTVASPEIQRAFAGSTHVRFDGWSPSFLPLRVPFRYFLVTGLALLLVGIALAMRCRGERLEE